MQNDQKLDNPVWHSLNETHANVALVYGNLNCYQPAYCPFGGFISHNSISNYLDQYSEQIDNFFIVGDQPQFSANLRLKKELVCLQMIVNSKIGVPVHDEIVKLGDSHHKQLFDLVNLVQPGYFKARTMLLGDYYGIFKDEMLVSVAGERMKMNDYTEVSAVVTHPGHTGKGYAKQLIAHTVNKIFDQHKIPYLHVAESNSEAIRLYERLGFKTRRKISFWNYERQTQDMRP